jgi:uncharacterized protein (DUF58 family)
MKPGPALVAAAFVWFLLGAAGFFSSAASMIWLYAGLSFLPIIAADGLALFFLTDRLSVKREISTSLAQGVSTAVKLEISNNNRRNLLPSKILLWDLHPLSMGSASFPAGLNKKLLKSQGRLAYNYALTPKGRGQWLFRGCELLLYSPCRFWRLKVFHQCESSGRTYPDFKKIKAAAGTDLRGLLERTGLKDIRMRGQGLEFRSLRDYQEGDSVRAIDWWATSRRRKAIIREYQEEQDQQVLFLLDSGYRLHRLEGSDRVQFDSALEAVLLLSWIGLKSGDSVAVGNFGSDKRWLGPRKGLSAFPILMNGLYDLSSSPSPSSPFSALEDALAKLKRRTFIILISNFREEDGESLSWILKRIERRHLLLMVSLRETESEYLASRQPDGIEEALETAAAFSYLASRRELYRAWEHSGLLTMESTAEGLSAALINRYLQVKRSGRL